MPVLSVTDLARWRAHPQRVTGHVAIWEPDRIARRRVNQGAFAYPVSQLQFDNPDGDTGSIAEVEADMMIGVSTSAGVFKGWTRALRAPSGSVVYLHPTGQGDVEFADDDILDFWDDFRPYALIPYIEPTTGTLYKNYDEAYTDQTDEFAPVANANPSTLAGTVDAATNRLRVSFDALGELPSYAMATSATLAAYAWDIKDGEVISGGISSPALTVDFPPGKRWVKLTITDSNGTTAIKRVPIWAADDGEFAFRRAILSRRAYSHEAGWELSLDLADPDLSSIPDQALVIFVKDEYFGAYHGSIFSPVAFLGWLTDETLQMEPLWADHAVNALGPLGLLRQRPAFPQTMRRKAAPVKWSQVKGLDWWKAVVYLLKFHSNILELCDLERPSFYADYPVPRLDTEAGSLADPIDFLASAAFARLTCDQRGRLFLRRVPHTMTDAERATWPPVVELTAADLAADDQAQGPQFERAHADGLAWLRSSALIADTATSVPLLAIAPGKTPGQGTMVDSLDRLLVLSQAEFNERVGHAYAQRQRRRDGARALAGTLTLAHGGDVIDPAWQEPVALTLDAATNRRGFAFDQARVVPSALDILYDHAAGASLERLTVEEEAHGASAATEAVPSEKVTDQPAPPWIPPITVVPEPTPSAPPGAPELVYAADALLLRRTRDWSSATPTWETVYTETVASILDWMVDFLDPLNTAQIVTTDGLGTIFIYGTTNLDDTTPTWTLLRTFSSAYAPSAQITPTVQFANTWFLRLCNTTGNVVEVHHTHDNWATITSVIAGAWTGAAYDAACGFVLSGRAASLSDGKVYVGHLSAGKAALKRSDNYGATFNTVYTWPDGQQPTGLWMPWLDNPTEEKLYVSRPLNSAGTAGRIYRSENGGASMIDVSPIYDSTIWGVGDRNSYITRPIHLFAANPSLPAAFIGSKDNGPWHFFVSDVEPDSGADWQYRSTFPRAAFNIGGWPFDPDIYFVSGDEKLWYSTDGGFTWVEKQWVGYNKGVWAVPIWIA